MAIWVVLAAVGIVGGLFALICAIAKPTKKQWCLTALLLIGGMASIFGADYCWDETPIMRYHEILYRGQDEFRLIPDSYRFIARRGDIIVIEEIQPACTRGEYNNDPYRWLHPYESSQENAAK